MPCACFPTAFGGDRAVTRQPRRALRALSAAPNACAGDTRGTHPQTRGAPLAPHPPRAVPGPGLRTATAPLLCRQRWIWGIAVFALLTSGPEAQRGGDARGAPLRAEEAAIRAQRSGHGARRSRPAAAASPGDRGLPRVPVRVRWNCYFWRPGSCLGRALFFTCTLNAIAATERKGTLTRAWEAWMQPCKMCH